MWPPNQTCSCPAGFLSPAETLSVCCPIPNVDNDITDVAARHHTRAIRERALFAPEAVNGFLESRKRWGVSRVWEEGVIPPSWKLFDDAIDSSTIITHPVEKEELSECTACQTAANFIHDVLMRPTACCSLHGFLFASLHRRYRQNLSLHLSDARTTPTSGFASARVQNSTEAAGTTISAPSFTHGGKLHQLSGKHVAENPTPVIQRAVSAVFASPFYSALWGCWVLTGGVCLS